MTPALSKLAALGAYAVSAGLVVVLAFLVWLMWPTGMNLTEAWVGILCAAVPILVIIAVHIALARQLTHRG